MGPQMPCIGSLASAGNVVALTICLTVRSGEFGERKQVKLLTLPTQPVAWSRGLLGARVGRKGLSLTSPICHDCTNAFGLFL